MNIRQYRTRRVIRKPAAVASSRSCRAIVFGIIALFFIYSVSYANNPGGAGVSSLPRWRSNSPNYSRQLQ